MDLLNTVVDKLLAVSENGKARTSRLATLFVKNLEKPKAMYKSSEDKIIQISTIKQLLSKCDDIHKQNGNTDKFLATSYVASVLFSYIRDLVVKYPEESSWIASKNFLKNFKLKGDEIADSLDDAFYKFNNDPEKIILKFANVIRLLTPMLKEIVVESHMEVMYRLDYNSYLEKSTHSFLDKIREELVQRTWHPKRLKWCLDYEEQKEIWGL